jgi:hypothetical protein
LEKRGFSKEMVSDYIEAKQEQAAAIRSHALDGVGEEKFAEVVDWAKANLTKADLDAYNRLVDTAKTKDDHKAAVANLVARYEQANGHEPALINAKGASARADVYRDISEMQRDMSDPRYEKSEAFRAEVSAKLARSNIY